MRMRTLLLFTAALSASPALSAEAVKRKPLQPPALQFGVAPAETPRSAGPAPTVPPPRKSRRVRYSIPPPTRM